MALPAPCRLAIEIALHKRTDFRFGLRQRYDVGPCIQLPLCVPADDLVLPKRESLGVGLIHCGNTDIGSLLGIKHIDVAKVARVERQLDSSFIVFEKITYLVDIYRRISRPAGRFATYLLYVFFFPKLLAGPIIKYHEMEDQLAAMPAARLDDISVGFLRFMMGVAKKTLIADTLATGADQIFAADASGIGFSSRLERGHLLHLPDLFRLLGLLGHGDRHRPHARLPPARELRHAVHRLQHHRVLATLAYLAHHLDTRISVHSARRQPCFAASGLYQPLGLLSCLRSVAWRGVDLRRLGRLQRPVPGLGPAVSAPPAGPTAANSWQTSSPSPSSWSVGQSSAPIHGIRPLHSCAQ